jgi:hypothetical protein
MAGGHVNRAQRPNTWLHRPICTPAESPCQPGAVHTWPLTSFTALQKCGRYRIDCVAKLFLGVREKIF